LKRSNSLSGNVIGLARLNASKKANDRENLLKKPTIFSNSKNGARKISHQSVATKIGKTEDSIQRIDGDVSKPPSSQFSYSSPRNEIRQELTPRKIVSPSNDTSTKISIRRASLGNSKISKISNEILH
jgi:hypothetical protein